MSKPKIVKTTCSEVSQFPLYVYVSEDRQVRCHLCVGPRAKEHADLELDVSTTQYLELLDKKVCSCKTLRQWISENLPPAIRQSMYDSITANEPAACDAMERRSCLDWDMGAVPNADGKAMVEKCREALHDEFVCDKPEIGYAMGSQILTYWYS